MGCSSCCKKSKYRVQIRQAEKDRAAAVQKKADRAARPGPSSSPSWSNRSSSTGSDGDSSTGSSRSNSHSTSAGRSRPRTSGTKRKTNRPKRDSKSKFKEFEQRAALEALKKEHKEALATRTRQSRSKSDVGAQSTDARMAVWL